MRKSGSGRPLNSVVASKYLRDMKPGQLGLSTQLVRAAAALVVATIAAVASAQPRVSPYRIGVLANTIPLDELKGKTSANPMPRRLEDGLRDLGWVDGGNIQFVYRSAEGDLARLPSLARDLVAQRVDVIVAAGHGVGPAMEATSSIPIVMAASGFMVTPATRRPQANVTGLTLVTTPDFEGKRMALLKELDPRIRRVAIVDDSPWQPDEGLQAAAGKLGLTLIAVHFGRDPAMIPKMIEQVVRDRADAVIVGEGLYLHTPEVQVTLHSLALKYRLPMLHSNLTAVENGGLVAYGPDIADLQRRAAYFVDRILRGARASDLPIEQPSRFVLSLNRKTAAAIGVRIPPSLLLQAVRVIE
jgi:putative tryptophan/tyrosine transport system substrate-binding protein